MSIRINNILIFAIFLLGNIILISILIYLAVLTQKNSVLNFSQNTKSTYVPLLDKNIRDIHVASRAFIIYDPLSRVVIAGKNQHLRFTPASTAKIMTALIVLEEYKLDKILTAENILEVEGSKMKLQEKESITVENLLYGLMLPSANDAAYILAKNYLPAGKAGPGGVEGFVNRMNEKAKMFKLENTRFVDPSGYSDENLTTAFDLARLASHALRNQKLREIVSTKQKTVTDTTGAISHELHNLNELLGVEGVSGIKTGFTQEAGGVLVSSVEDDGKTYVIIVLNSEDRFQDTKNIIINALKKINLVSY